MSYRHRCSSTSLAGLEEAGYPDLPRVPGLPPEVGACLSCGSLSLFLAVLDREADQRLFFVCRACYKELIRG